MKAKRADQQYRDSERVRDRIRRRTSRYQNDDLRKREMERDRQYKKLQRCQNKADQATTSVSIEQDIKLPAYTTIIMFENTIPVDSEEIINAEDMLNNIGTESETNISDINIKSEEELLETH